MNMYVSFVAEYAKLNKARGIIKIDVNRTRIGRLRKSHIKLKRKQLAQFAEKI